MLDQTFSAQNLMGLMIRTDPGKYKLGRTRGHYLRTMEDLSSEIHNTNFEFGNFSNAIRSGKTVYSTTSSKDEFVIRKLNDNIRRLYNVRQANRAEIMSQLKLLLEEKIPFFAIKVDIKDFYESVPRKKLVKRICEESMLSYRGKELLKKLLLNSTRFTGNGLPRGISISATLSELNMQEFDKKVRATEGVYYFARYVDDIIILSYSDADIVVRKIKEALYPDMVLNEEKTETIAINEKGNCTYYNPKPEISYLGYKFQFRLQSDVPTNTGTKGQPSVTQPPRINIKIADGKVAKLKKRIILSLLSYTHDKNYPLLLSRIKFLSGNCRMHRKGETGELLSGIFYNYPLIDESGQKELKLISKFLRSSVFSKNGNFGKKINGDLSAAQKEELAKLCFYAGHSKKITQSISAKRLQQIKKCWNHV